VTLGGVEWRAGGLLAQFLPDSPERLRRADLDPGDAPLERPSTIRPKTTNGSRPSRAR